MASMGRREPGLVYTNFADDADWRASENNAATPWEDEPEFSKVPFFHLNMIKVDWMHCWHLGCGRDLAGATLKIMARSKFWYPQRRIDLRLRAITQDIKLFTAARGKQLSIKILKKASLHWFSDVCPELHASAYDTAMVISWLAHKLQQEPPPREAYGVLPACLWCADHLSRIITEAGVFLDEAEKNNIQAVGSAFLASYEHLAQEALQRGEKLFKLRPKIHQLDHIITDSTRRRSGRNYGWDTCWYDEDWVKYAMKIYRRVAVRTAQKNLLRRNLVQVRECLTKAVRSLRS